MCLYWVVNVGGDMCAMDESSSGPVSGIFTYAYSWNISGGDLICFDVGIEDLCFGFFNSHFMYL